MVREQKSIHMHVSAGIPGISRLPQDGCAMKELAKFASYSEFPTKIALKPGDFVF